MHEIDTLIPNLQKLEPHIYHVQDTQLTILDQTWDLANPQTDPNEINRQIKHYIDNKPWTAGQTAIAICILNVGMLLPLIIVMNTQ